MNDILKTYMERFRENRHTLRRYTAFVLALAMITTLFVNWQLHGVGISMTAQYQCGEEEHTHTADCYTKVLTCGYEEGELENADEVAAAAATSQPTVEAEPMPLSLEPQIEFVPHEHTDDCYTEVQTLTCMEEEHVHDDDCFDPEDGSLICDKFEHTHDESCYTTEYELTCGLEEGELVEQVVEPTQSAALAAMAVAEPVALAPMVDTVEPIYHHHTDACYEEVLTCPLPEHHHTVACLSDTSADLETPEEWQAANAEAAMTGNWAEDLVSVAQTQLGYEQSEKNFEIDPADGVTLRYYSRYGQSYGNPYGEWDVMFLSYCLKYAGIPQSAIPQEASVLALRSSMSDMDWLLDGEDGSAADVGDIVIYNKYVTRTVAVDSSADGAADGLDDLFSMDAESENGVELEKSSDDALDAVPAAEDMTTLDTPDLPDIPDTANPEQPAAKPMDSADTAAPSVGSPAAEPQTTTVTDAQPVETVGIVSSVDSNADTLTVISGDVDGKVAEVQLSFAEVLGVVDVAAAQYADTYGGQLPTISASRPNRAPALTAGGTTELQENWINKATATVNGKEHTIKDNYTPQIVPDLTVKDGGRVELTYHFTIPSDSNLPADTNKLTYKLPAGFTLGNDTTGTLKNESNQPIGSIYVDTYGNVTLTFDNSLNGKQISGHFYVDCTVDKNTATNQQEIKFPGAGTTITIEQKTNLTVKKEGKHNGRTEDGKYILHYTITAKSDYGSGKPIELSDYLNLGDSFKNASYENITIKKKTRTESTELTDFLVQKVPSSGLSSDGIADGNPGIKITDKNGNGLPALGEKESYILEYDVYVDHVGPNAATLLNRVYANDEKDKQEIHFHNELGKSGSYDPESGEITWTISIKPNNASIYGFELKDTLPTGHTMTGYFKVSGNSSGTILEETNKFTGAAGFTYKFDDAKFNTSNPDYEYTVTYKTKAPANFTVGSSVTNTASLELNNKKKWDASGTASYDNRGQSHHKEALDNTTLDESTANGEPFKMRWKLTVTPPYVWNASGGQSDKLLEITDCINKPWVSSGTVTSSDHYAILKDLHKEITEHLVLTLKDGTEIKYADLAKNKLSLQIEYYSTNDCSGSPLATVKLGDPLPTDASHVGSFKLVFQKDGYTGARIDSVVISQYSTWGSFSGLSTGQTIGFKNESNGSSAEYKYNIPDKPADMKLIKMSAAKPPKDAKSAGDYKTDNVKVTAGKGADGETYIYYQLKLETNYGIPSLPATITDTLPDHVTYVDGSAQLIAEYSKSNQWTSYYTASVNYSSASRGWQTDISLSDARFFTHTYDSASNSLNFKLNSEIKDVATQFTSFYIRYTVKVDNSIWNSSLTDTQIQYFDNSAKWEGVDDSTTRTTVEYKSTLLKKKGSYDASANEVTYSIVINPNKLKLGNDSMITLTDTLVVKKRPTNSAALVDSSVKLYSYDASTGEKGVELPSDSYKTDYKETTNAGKDQSLYILTVKVPNEQSYLLEYKYANTSNTSYEMKNEATLYGYTTEEITTDVAHNTASGSAHTVGLTIHKVDSHNVKTSLTDAHFQLEKYDPNTKEFKVVRPDIPARKEDGSYFYLSFSNSGSTTPDGTILYPFNTLYRLTETQAPEGYAKDSSPHYFIWTTAGTDSNTAYFNAVGSTQLTEVAPGDVNYYYEGDAITLTVKNTSNRLIIQKLWQDNSGNYIGSSDTRLPAEITVKLYKRNAPSDAGTFVKEFTLTRNTDWKATYDVPASDLNCYFYVEETSTNTRYDVEYTVNNVQGADIILVTNKEKENAGYELPSTGGTGTLPYTAVGGTMMLSALAYSFIHRKRRHEGRADD